MSAPTFLKPSSSGGQRVTVSRNVRNVRNIWNVRNVRNEILGLADSDHDLVVFLKTPMMGRGLFVDGRGFTDCG